MAPVRNNLLVSPILNRCVIIILATGILGSSYASERIEPCPPAEVIFNDKPFIEAVGFKIDNFENLPRDVQCFVDVALVCETLSGEEPHDDESAQELADDIMDYCNAARNQMVFLRKKYHDQPDILQILAVCDHNNYVHGPACAYTPAIED